MDFTRAQGVVHEWLLGIQNMETLVFIIVGGLLMSAIAMVGAVTILLQADTLDRLLLPLVALAAGTLLGGAFFMCSRKERSRVICSPQEFG